MSQWICWDRKYCGIITGGILFFKCVFRTPNENGDVRLKINGENEASVSKYYAIEDGISVFYLTANGVLATKSTPTDTLAKQ